MPGTLTTVLIIGSRGSKVSNNMPQLSEADKRRADDVIKENEAMMGRSIEQFRREVAHGLYMRLTSGSHYFFITNEDEVVRIVREFLAAVAPS